MMLWIDKNKRLCLKKKNYENVHGNLINSKVLFPVLLFDDLNIQ